MSHMKTLQVTSGGLWSVASPIIAVVVAVPLSVALTTSVMARQSTATADPTPTVSTATYTPAASMGGQNDMQACSAPVSDQDHMAVPMTMPGHGGAGDEEWGGDQAPTVEHAAAPVTNVSNAWNTFTANVNNENYWFSLYKSSLSTNNSFNKDSFNTVNSNNRDDSQTHISANGGSTVVAPTNTSSNVTIGQGNQQSSALTNDNLAASNTENKTENTTTNTSVNTDIDVTNVTSNVDKDPAHHMPWENGDPDPAHHKS